MLREALLPALFAVLATTAASAQDAAAPATAAPAPPAKPIRAKKVCRSETVLGSNIPDTTCHTQAEWDQIDASTRANAREIMNHQPPR